VLSYRHAFHAGNFADVHKHVALTAALACLQQKEKPFTYLDTHAGAGAYVLADRDDGSPGEWREGVGRLRVPGTAAGGVAAADAPAEVRAYLGLVDEALAATGEYPGSPALARAMLRPQDRAVLLELHPAEATKLKSRFRGDRQVGVHAPRDAREGLRALLPSMTPRGLVLIDPSYERRAEYAEVAGLLAVLRRHWATATMMIWYPLLGSPRRGRHRTLLDAVAAQQLPEVLISELRVRDFDVSGLCGSGLIIVAPPWPFGERWPRVANWLQAALSDAEV
jgi:23S rRNA (adenine2030-N6)-methyltransferase